MKHDDIPILLCAADVFCLPTLSEGSCNAVVEAMACGIPVISSNLSFNDDVLTEENAIRIDPSSVDEIREAIYEIKVNNVLRDRLGKAALKTSEGLNIKNRAKKILNFMFRGNMEGNNDSES